MTDIKYKEKIDLFIQQNHKEIQKICEKSCDNTNFEAEDLYAELYIFLIDNKDKVQNIIEIPGKDRPLMRYIAQWCYNNIRLYTANRKASNFKAKYQINDTNCDFLTIELEDDYQTVKQNKLEKEFKYQLLNEKINTLDDINKKLYNIYIIENKNFKEIAEHFNITKYSAKRLVSQMLNQLKNG
jgi:RNA polymerase sigma factor (sigma-70 family)